MLPAPAKIYRRSELEAISDGCYHRYKAIWIDGVDDSSDVALVGIGFHAIQHVYIELLVRHKLSQDQELSQEAFVAGVASAQTPARLVSELRQLWDFHAPKFELPLERFVAAEERGSDGDVGWTPDLVLAHPETNTLEIVDTKSGWHPPLSEEEVKGLFQAKVYCRYAMDRWPHFGHYQFTLHAIRFNKRTSVSFSPVELEAVELEVRAAIEAIEEAKRTNHWPAVPGPSCNFCELACPVADQVMTLPKRLTPEQYSKLGAWLLVADKQLRAAKKLMKASCNVFGPCDVNGVVWDNRPSESKAYPVDAVLEVLKTRGIWGAFDDAGSQGLTISHSALAKLIKAYPMLEEDLAPFAQTKTTYRFGAKQAGVDAGDDE